MTNKNMNKSRVKQSAFTIVELLVVIVVIGILAAITIVSYAGVTARATQASLQSDLINSSQQLKIFQVDNSTYPSSVTDCPTPAAGNICLKVSSGTVYLYSVNNNSNPQTFSIYATKNNTKYRITNDSNPIAAVPVVATGGNTVADIGGYRIHTFISSGTFTVTSGDNVEVLVVGGGGSGGTSTGGLGGGGGGGAGGLIYNLYNTITAQVYNVTVGNGGASVIVGSSRGNNGSNSVFNSLTAIGGGGGGRGTPGDPGSVGGSGGGAGYNGYTFLAGSLGVLGQGSKGGDTLSNNNGGGGGGAGGVGGNTNLGGPSGNGGLGGPGLSNSISGTSIIYSKGGGGGSPPGGFANGVANTGNGGSGVYAAEMASSGAGGSGIVIIRYQL